MVNCPLLAYQYQIWYFFTSEFVTLGNFIQTWLWLCRRSFADNIFFIIKKKRLVFLLLTNEIIFDDDSVNNYVFHVSLMCKTKNIFIISHHLRIKIRKKVKANKINTKIFLISLLLPSLLLILLHQTKIVITMKKKYK